MNRRKLSVPVSLMLAGVLAAASALAGQPKSEGGFHHGRHSAENHAARLAESLDLSDEQAAEVLIVLEAAEEERRGLHQRLMEQIEPELCAQREATHAEILAVLTPEQAAEFEEMIAEHRNRSWGQRPRGGFMDVDCDAG